MLASHTPAGHALCMTATRMLCCASLSPPTPLTNSSLPPSLTPQLPGGPNEKDTRIFRFFA